MTDIAVIKCGGSIIDNLTDEFFGNVTMLQENGVSPIIVHGGGPAIEKMLERLEVPFTFTDGLRTTSSAAMDVVEMVLTGHVNNAMTRRLNASGIQAAGFSGSDVNLLSGVPKDFQIYGHVGEVSDVNVSFLNTIIDQGIIPVIAPIAAGEDGSIYNINADTVAGAIASATASKRLIFMTDVPGIMNDGTLLDSVTQTEIDNLIAKGVIHGGMIPKVKAAMACLSDDLHDVMIADANQVISHSGFIGTRIKKSGEAV